MKSTRILPTAAIAAALLAVLASGCSKQERSATSEKVKEAAVDSGAAMAKAWDDVKAHTYEKRSDFQDGFKALTSKMDSEISQLRANYSEAKANASRKAAMEELKNSEADYKEKLAAVGNATADTWDSAKRNAISAWDKMQAAYYKAKAD